MASVRAATTRTTVAWNDDPGAAGCETSDDFAIEGTCAPRFGEGCPSPNALSLKSLDIPDLETRGCQGDRVASSLETTAAPASASASMKALKLVLTLLFYSLRALGRSRSDLLLENVACVSRSTP